MTHHLFLANNNIADFQIPAFDIGTEVIPPPKENETAAQNELSFVSNKLFISFGVMIICAIIITCLLVLFRRKIQNNQVAQTSQQIENDPQTKLALAQQTLAYAEQTLAVDPENKDALAARDAANNVIAELTNTANINTVSNTQTQQANVMPNVQTNVYSQNAGIPVVPGFNGMGYDMNQYSQFASNPVSTNPFAVNTLNN